MLIYRRFGFKRTLIFPYDELDFCQLGYLG